MEYAFYAALIFAATFIGLGWTLHNTVKRQTQQTKDILREAAKERETLYKLIKAGSLPEYEASIMTDLPQSTLSPEDREMITEFDSLDGSLPSEGPRLNA